MTGAGKPNSTEAHAPSYICHQDMTPVSMVPQTCLLNTAVIGVGREGDRGKRNRDNRGCMGGGRLIRRRLDGQGRAEIPKKCPEAETDERGSKTKTKKSKCTPAAPMFPVFLTNHQ